MTEATGIAAANQMARLNTPDGISKDDFSPEVASSATISAPRTAGRPRNGAIDLAIRQASWSLLSEGGYDALTFDALAERANCSRAALYRRFLGKPDLVKTLLEEACRLTEPELEPGTPPRDALIAYLRSSADFFAGAEGKALLSMFAAQAQIPRLASIIRANTAQESAIYAVKFQDYVGGGLDSKRLTLLFNMLTGAAMFSGSVLAMPLADEEVDALVDAALFLAERSV